MQRHGGDGRRYVLQFGRALLLIGLLAVSACSDRLPEAASFTDFPDQPGSLLHAEPIPSPTGMVGYRILYRSAGLQGETVLVSGIVVLPAGAPPADERPVIAWAHPTTGVAPRCAPSNALIRFQMIQGLRDMVERGYAVVATDYPGLGTAGPHPYLVGESEARAVLDSVRALRQMPDARAGNRFAVWGHSQGGHAALHTGLLADRYAPELRLVGVAAAAPATDLTALLEADLGTPAGKNLTAMTLWSWARVYGAPLGGVVDPAAMAAVDRLAGECIESIYDIVLRQHTERPLEARFLSVRSLAATEPWAGLLRRNTPGTLPPRIPVFLSQGTADEIIRPAITRDAMRRLCQGGSAVTMVVLPGVNHAFAGRDSAGAAVAWMSDRFAERPAPSDCGVP